MRTGHQDGRKLNNLQHLAAVQAPAIRAPLIGCFRFSAGRGSRCFFVALAVGCGYGNFLATSGSHCRLPFSRMAASLRCSQPRSRPKVPLFPHGLIEGFDQLAHLAPLTSLKSVARDDGLTLSAFWAGGLCPWLPSSYRLGLPSALLGCPGACCHDWFPLIVCFSQAFPLSRTKPGQAYREACRCLPAAARGQC